LKRLTPYKVDPCPNDIPWKWEMGTRDQALFASISAVMDYLSWLGSKVQSQVTDKLLKYSGRARLLKAVLSWMEGYEQMLSATMLDGTARAPGMRTINRIEIYGLKDASRLRMRTPTFSFNLRGVPAKKVAKNFWDKHAIVVIGDDFCSRALMIYGQTDALRASLVHCNTIEEVETFLKGLTETAKEFNAG